MSVVHNVTVWSSSGGQYVAPGGVSKTGSPPPPPPTITMRFPADPNATQRKRIYLGAAVSGNSYAATAQYPAGSPNTVAEHESATGVPLGVHRQYWSTLADYSASSPLVQGALSDHNAGRLPWVSFKFAMSNWQAVGNGGFDAQLDQLIASLNALSHDTILTLNHEPENDWKQQSALSESAWTTTYSAYWRSMQSRVRNRIQNWITNNSGKTNRIAFASCLMSYTWSSSSGRNPDDWYVSGAHDFVGVDHYADTNQVVDQSMWTSFVSWCQGKPIPFGVGEFGVRSYDSNGSSKLSGFFNELTDGTKDCVCLSYFDSNQNDGTAGWILTDQYGVHSEFHTLMTDSRALHVSDLGA